MKRDKLSSSYNKNENIIHSDEESDKTLTEKYNKTKNIRKGRKASSLTSKNNEKMDITKYKKRDHSLDIVRNKNDEYDIVLPYQRIKK